jgi:D-alanine--poly(phosphoribitol) ligase subunit 2
MADSGVTARVQRLFVDALTVEVPSSDTDLIETGLLDSLALVELLFALEREFGVAIPLEQLEIDAFRTAESIAEYISAARPAV